MQIHYRRTGRGVLLSALILAHLSLSAGEGTAVPPPEGTLLLQDFRTLSPDAPLPDGWKTSGKVRIRKTGSAAALALPGGARADRDLKLPEEIEQKFLKEVSRLSKQPSGSSEAAVIRNYLDTCLELPWNKRTKERVDVKAAR